MSRDRPLCFGSLGPTETILTGLRQLLPNVVLAAVAALFAVGATELGARLLVPAWAPSQAERNFWAYHPVLGWAHRPGQRGRFTHRDFAVSVSINSFGLRDREYPLERVPGTRRMLVLGDSFAWGFGVEQEQAVSERLEREEPGWEIVNAGVSGYGTDQQLLWLVQRGLSLRPDVVLLLFHGGDVKDNNQQVRYGYRKAGFVLAEDRLVLTGVPVERASARWRLRRHLLHNTWVLHRVAELPARLATLLSQGRAAGRVRAATTASAPTPAASGSTSPAEAPPTVASGSAAGGSAAARERGGDWDFRVTARLLELLDAVVEHAGARLVVVSIPLRDPEPPLGEVLEPLGVPHLSLGEALDAAEGPVRFAHDEHWTPEGHRVAADAIAAFLRERGLFGAKGPRSR